MSKNTNNETENTEVCIKSMHKQDENYNKILAYVPDIGVKEVEFIMKKLEGLSLDQICREMKISKTTAMTLNSSLKMQIKEVEMSVLLDKLRANKQTVKDRVERSFNYLKVIDSALAKKIKSDDLETLTVKELLKMRSDMEGEIQNLGKALEYTKMKSVLDDVAMTGEIVEPDL